MDMSVSCTIFRAAAATCNIPPASPAPSRRETLTVIAFSSIPAFPVFLSPCHWSVVRQIRGNGLYCGLNSKIACE